mmetsp:Transcript_91326/g.195860  ORF Transcript_91326/g.195860 Transcript_91326/m.195860 type:complete len:284 (-) Transcript_91326:225-1076(-)
MLVVGDVPRNALEELLLLGRRDLEMQGLLQYFDEGLRIDFPSFLLVMALEALVQERHILLSAPEGGCVQLYEHAQGCACNGIVLGEFPHVPDDATVYGHLALRLRLPLRPVRQLPLGLALHLQPCMLRGFRCREPLVGVFPQHGAHEVLSCLRDALPTFTGGDEAALADLRHDVSIGLAVEGWHPAEEHVNNDAHGPHVTRQTIGAFQHLRSHIEEGAQRCSKLHGRLYDLPEAEVAELQLGIRRIALKQPILQLQVAVANILGMEIRYRIQHLPRHSSRIEF